ncbi:MAG: hypothetical protein KDA81_22180, partial [Planctomycetaceae bacterium]|nr:hypothetical protein [Planctomycetaceae bacterium]
MNIEKPQPGNTVAGPSWALLLCLCAFLTGCKVYPTVPRKSLTELYYEALAHAGNQPDRNGSVPAISGHQTVSASTPIAPPVFGESSISSDDALPNHGFEPIPFELPPGQSTSPGPPEPAIEEPPASEEERDLSPAPTKIRLLPVIEKQSRTIRQSSWIKANEISKTVVRSSAEPAVRSVYHMPSPTASGSTVSDVFEDTDIRQALQSIASQAEVSLIVDEQVGGVVSGVVEDEPFETALRRLVMPLGLVYRRMSENEYLVGVPDPSSPLFSRLSERFDYRPTNLSPDELVKLIPERDQKYIQAVDARNRILIEAPPEIAHPLIERLQQFDTPIPQVELEAIVCVISPDHGFKSGLDWGHAVTLNGSELLNIGMAGLAVTGNASGKGVSNAFGDFAVTSAFVKLLAQEGYLAIRAAPRVTARDGDQARISITRQSFFSTQPQSTTQFFRQEVEQVEAGIELDITPIIRGDNITVKIEKAEVSEDIRTSQINTGITENPFPQINRRTVSTTVHVKDGQTIVIGGLVQRQTVDRIAKIPV